jgi:hypothetical protein
VRGEALFRNVDYRVARTTGEREAIYALRYRAFLKGGVIPESDDKRVTDKYDDAPNSWIFGVHVDDKLIGSVLLHLLTKECRESKCALVHRDIVYPRLDRGEIIVDAARFAVDPDVTMLELPYLIMRLGYVMCEAFNADTGIIACSPQHAKFYERVFLHKPLTQPGSFPGVPLKSVLIATDFKADKRKVLARFPIMQSSAFERRMLFFGDRQLQAA